MDMTKIHDRLDWNLLRTFLAIVQESSISKAAERLHLTQPAVSLALKRLEERLDQVLILRGNGNFELTGAGALVYRESLEIYGSVARLALTVSNAPNDLTGIIRIAVVSGVHSNVFENVLNEFHINNPRVNFEINVSSSEEVQNALIHHDAALGISLKYRSVKELNDMVLLNQRYCLFCSEHHPLFGKKHLTVDQLRNENFISFASEQLDGVLAPLALFRAKERLEGNVIGTSSSLNEVKRMIRIGMGIGALPELVVKDDVAAGRLWQLPPYNGIAKISLHLMWNKNARFSEVEKAFFLSLTKALEKAG